MYFVGKTEPKIYVKPFPAAGNTKLFLNPNLRVNPLADLKIEGRNVEHLLTR
jgi:hypothetical protein